MEPRRPDQHHTASRELLAGRALGILTPDEQAALDQHLAAYPDLVEELAILEGAVEALPLSLEDREPSPALRQRLEAAVLADLAATGAAPPRQAPPPATFTATPAPPPTPIAPPTPIRPRPMNVWALAAAVLLVIASAAVIWGLQQGRPAGQPERTIALQVTDAAPGATGELAYLPDSRVMVLSVNDLPPLPPDMVYEIWLIDNEGEPIPFGAFSEPTHQHAMSGSLDDYQAVALTIEPGPLGVTQPTSEPFASAALGPE